MYLRFIYLYFYAVTSIPLLKSLADTSHPVTTSFKKKKKNTQQKNPQTLNGEIVSLKQNIFNVNSTTKTKHIYLAREQRHYYRIHFPMQIPYHKYSQVSKKNLGPKSWSYKLVDKRGRKSDNKINS